MTYKDFDIFKTIDRILIPTSIIVLSGFLLFFIITGYSNYSYNKGFYDGANALCDEGVIIINDELICVEDSADILDKYVVRGYAFQFNLSEDIIE